MNFKQKFCLEANLIHLINKRLWLEINNIGVSASLCIKLPVKLYLINKILFFVVK